MQIWKKHSSFTLMIVVMDTALLLILIGFMAVPLVGGSEAQSINHAGLQRARSQQISRAVLIIEYRPATEKSEAINDLQMILPAFRQEQELLLTSQYSDVQSLLTQSRLDYLALIEATQAILTHPNDPIDPLQVDIILNHDQAYFITMNNLVQLLQQHADGQNFQLFWIETSIIALLLILAVSAVIVSRRTWVKLEQNIRNESARQVFSQSIGISTE